MSALGHIAPGHIEDERAWVNRHVPRRAFRRETATNATCGPKAAGRTLRRMDKLTQLEILARAFLGGLVERHGREHAAASLARPRGLTAGI